MTYLKGTYTLYTHNTPYTEYTPYTDCVTCVLCVPPIANADKTYAPRLPIHRANPLETGGFRLHMIMNHGEGRDK